MIRNGRAVANDIEMILTAFAENTWQYYIPKNDSATQKISTAIKLEQEFMNGGNKYVWDNQKLQFIQK